MTAFTLRFNPGFENDDLEIAVYDASGAFHAKSTAAVATDAAGNFTATATVNTTAIGDQLVVAELRSDTSGEILNNQQHSLNVAGDAIIPPESNITLEAKLDTIIADGAKEATLAAHDTSIDAQLAALQTAVDALDTAAILAVLGTPVLASMSLDIAAVQSTANKVPRAEADLADGEAVHRSKNSNGGSWIDKDNIRESLRTITP